MTFPTGFTPLQNPLDMLQAMKYRLRVQPGDSTHKRSKCKSDLHSQLQRRHGVRLNTSRQARAACGAVSLRMAASLDKTRLANFSRLNPDTGSGHSRPETCGAILRGVLRLAVAIGPMLERLKHPPHRQHKENVKAFHGDAAADNAGRKSNPVEQVRDRKPDAFELLHGENPCRPHQKPCGFPFASHFRRWIVACPHQTRAPVSRLSLPRANAFTFPWGVALFSALVFRFTHFLLRACVLTFQPLSSIPA